MLRPKGRLIRINVTIDEGLLAMFDAVLGPLDLKRSQAITQLIEDYLKEQALGRN